MSRLAICRTALYIIRTYIVADFSYFCYSKIGGDEGKAKNQCAYGRHLRYKNDNKRQQMPEGCGE
jgi:hypothetical protein